MNNQDDSQQTPSTREQKDFYREPTPIKLSDREHQLGVRVESTPEQSAPEQQVEEEASPERVKSRPDQPAPDREQEKISTAAPVQPLPKTKPAVPITKTAMRKNVERILSEDLAEIYQAMNEQQKLQFKAEGEQVSSKIEELLQHVKIKAKEILVLIKNWLSKIPGVNKFFLIQEAKIKTDKILALRNKK